MPSFDFEGIELYYEEHGSGEPLVILNGIFMSAASWQPFVPSFSATNRLLLLDLVDQGRSSKVGFEYTQEIQERAVVAFLDHLGIERASLCGISYGGEVAMRIAARHPERVNKLVLANTTAYTSHWLRDIGRSWEHAMASHDGHAFFATCIPIVYSPKFYETNDDWLAAREDMFLRVFTPETYDAFARLTRSAETHDERANLASITAPTLVLSWSLTTSPRWRISWNWSRVSPTPRTSPFWIRVMHPCMKSPPSSPLRSWASLTRKPKFRWCRC